jgi:membrane protein required for colicin V production
MTLDAVFLLLLLYAIYLGVTKGLILQLTGLLALLLRVYLAHKFSFLLLPLLARLGFKESLAIAAFVIMFILLVIAARLIGISIDKIIKLVLLGWVNRLCGAVFSLFKMALIISVSLLLLNIINDTINLLPRKQINESKLYSPLLGFAPRVLPYLDLDKIKAAMQDIDHRTDEVVEKAKSKKLLQ